MIKKLSPLLVCVGLWSCSSLDNESPPFNQFIKTIEKYPIEKRNELVVEYLSKIDKTPIIEDSNKIHFVAYVKADSLLIRGDLQNGWAIHHKMEVIDCGKIDFFYKSYEIPANSQIEYQFVRNGEIMLDGLNKDVETNFEFGDRNIFRMPGFVKSPYLDYRHEVSKGIVVPLIMERKTKIFMDRKMHIYLPPGYNVKNRYPVILVNDGDIKLYTTPFKNVLDNLINDSLIVPIIAVFIPAMERDKEYCDKNIEFVNYLIYEIIPFIKTNYSTYNEPENWGIMGASGGGMISMATGFLYPEVIANVANQAGSLPENWCNDKILFSTYLTKRSNNPLKNVYIEVGAFDLEFPQVNTTLLQEARVFHHKLDSLHIDHRYIEFNDGHRDSNWNQSIDDILIQFFGK